jgi:hypothetical protein
LVEAIPCLRRSQGKTLVIRIGGQAIALAALKAGVEPNRAGPLGSIDERAEEGRFSGRNAGTLKRDT